MNSVDRRKLDIGMRLGHRERLFDDLDALALQHVGKSGVVFQMRVIERGDQLAFAAVPVMKHRRDDAARLELLVKPEPVEHFQRGGMIGAGARHLFEEIVVAQRFDQADFLVGLRQRQRQAQADGACADDDDAIGIGGHTASFPGRGAARSAAK